MRNIPIEDDALFFVEMPTNDLRNLYNQLCADVEHATEPKRTELIMATIAVEHNLMARGLI